MNLERQNEGQLSNREKVTLCFLETQGIVVAVGSKAQGIVVRRSLILSFLFCIVDRRVRRRVTVFPAFLYKLFFVNLAFYVLSSIDENKNESYMIGKSSNISPEFRQITLTESHRMLPKVI